MEWPVWRLVIHEPQIASLEEIDNYWTYEDILKGNALLDFKHSIEEKQIHDSKRTG